MGRHLVMSDIGVLIEWWIKVPPGDKYFSTHRYKKCFNLVTVLKPSNGIQTSELFLTNMLNFTL